jgi:hypothetical protein
MGLCVSKKIVYSSGGMGDKEMGRQGDGETRRWGKREIFYRKEAKFYAKFERIKKV